MADFKHYVIRGGIEGGARLRILSRVMQASTLSLFDRLGLCDGLVCFDVGCGGGDVTFELARKVAPHGKAVGADIDQTLLELARQEAQQQGVTNVEFRLSDIRQVASASEFDVVYARFLLTHLSDPASAVKAFIDIFIPGGSLRSRTLTSAVTLPIPSARHSGAIMNSTVRSCAGAAVIRTSDRDYRCS